MSEGGRFVASQIEGRYRAAISIESDEAKGAL